ncbi:exostosin-3-like [Daphnia carinata]|uniref:exostosin-3-like n=1 Tax=Daphnia carinata TaxID=120202 RepID=UPI00286932C4|nr:exostosin-3-like [Daphnia carinata]
METFEFRPILSGLPYQKRNRDGGFCHWLSTVRLSRIIFCILIVLVIIPIVTHYYLSSVGSEQSESFHSRNKLDLPDDLGSAKASEVKVRIEEMLRIKMSVNNELRDLEAKRQKLQAEISSLGMKIEELKNEAGRKVVELDRIKLSISQAEVAHLEILERNQPELRLPAKLEPNPLYDILPMPTMEAESNCSIFSCVDFSRCSLISNFPVYIYPFNGEGYEERISASLSQTFNYNPHITSNSQEACLFIYVNSSPESELRKNLQNLSHWAGDGRNHIIFNIGFFPKEMPSLISHAVNENSTFGRAMIVQSVFHTYRPHFDLLVPPLLGPPGSDVWYDLPSLTPARRRYLLSYSGHLQSSSEVQKTLEQLTASSTSDEFYFEFQCFHPKNESDSSLCGTIQTRSAVLQQSTFVLIPLPPTDLTSLAVQLRLYEALKYGSIPIMVGNHNAKFLLPYEDVIDWNRALIKLPTSRLPELHFYARAVTDRDILAMRRQGRVLWEKYFGSIQSIVDSVIAVFRHRIGIPPPAILDEPSPSVFNESFVPLKTEAAIQDINGDLDENLGPIEPAYPSPKFQRNLTFSLLHGYEMWNTWTHPFHLFPQTPYDPVMPSDAKFLGSGLGFRPIAGGSGGSGKEFSENLGGNLPREQFTIVILTYEREQVLIESVARLNGLPYLHKVVVVWNSPRPPSPDLKWPEIGVEVHVIRTLKNSLNNRFLPYDVIETEAVLSVDDDAHLRHDEIIFGFRVWREQRDKVVGFPGRFHAWDLEHKNWAYNSNYSCELSMILTGAAFYHKYYNYLYSLVMPQAIRDKVDEFMNCEDIAMNFLVSHITRQPPVKVTSRWTFRCPGCPVSLSEDETHFQERHKCINFFVKV